MERAMNYVSRVNADWHRENRMPKNANLDQRVTWHIEHAKACRCREKMPASIAGEIARRRQA
jgi:hypothetical protein